MSFPSRRSAVAITALLCGGLTALALPSVASAADTASIDIDHLQLAVTSNEFLGVEGGALPLRRWSFRAGATFGYADRLLLLEYGGSTYRLVSSRGMLDLTGAVTLGYGFTVGVDVPLAVVQTGAAVGDSFALGDLRVAGRYEIAGDRSYDLSLVLGVKIPTATSQQFLGEGSLALEPRLVGAVRSGMLHAGVNLGARLRERRIYKDLDVQHELTFAAAVGVTPARWIEGFAELHADAEITPTLFASNATPVELLVGAGGRWGDWHGRAAAGVGLVDGYGNPRARVIVGIAYEPRPPVVMPPPPPPVEEKKPEPKPEAPKPKVEPPKPEPPPAPVAASIVDPAEPSVSVSSDFVELADPIYFDKDSAHVHRRFFDELAELGRAINKRPWIKVLWIEGHTDDTGPEEWNLKLSELRADRISKFLVEHGVAEDRLRVLGFGEHKPWFSNGQETGRAKNRRVMFLIQRDESQPGPSETPVSPTPAPTADPASAPTADPAPAPMEKQP